MNLNKVFIMGRLTADPEIRTTPMGDRVTTLSIATNRVWSDKSGGKKEAAEFHNVVLWGRQADVAGQFLIKGSIVFVEGRLQTRSWQGKDGVTRRVTEIIGERMQLGPRPMGASRGGETFKRGNDVSEAERDEFAKDEPSGQEVPVIEMGDDGEIKPEDLPF
ncbi:MAG: single-stranded DNA-binding protein [Parcubacteria group bacterium]